MSCPLRVFGQEGVPIEGGNSSGGLSLSLALGAGCLPDVNSTAVVAIDFVYDPSSAFLALWVFWFLKKCYFLKMKTKDPLTTVSIKRPKFKK